MLPQPRGTESPADLHAIPPGKRALVHIGTTKTGSTSIQESLAKASKDDALAGISYPVLIGHGHTLRRNHNFFRVLYRPPEELTRTYRAFYSTPTGEGDRMRDIAAFRQGLAEAMQQHDKFIFSSEFMTNFSTDEIQAFRTEMAQLGVTDITPLIYVRNPMDRYLSSVQQRIKASSNFPSPARYHDGTLRCIRRWQEVFPNLIVRPFDRTLLRSGDVLTDFLDVIETHFDVQLDHTSIKSRSANESISAEGMIILHDYRLRFHSERDDIFMADSSKLIQMLLQSKARIVQTKPILNAASRRSLAARHRAFTDELWREYGIDYREPATGHHEEAETCTQMPPETVRDILETFDPNIVHELMLWLLHRNFINVGKLEEKTIRLRKKVADSTSAAKPRRKSIRRFLTSSKKIRKH